MKKIVVKIGTGVLTNKSGKLDESVMHGIVTQVAEIRNNGKDIIIVSSGAIGAGMGILNIKKRPTELSELQSMAAIGQTRLMDIYNGFFDKFGIVTGQILLTQEDFDDRKRYLNIKHTLNTLLGHKVVPIINENDTISTEEIRCGDNDRISFLVADLVRADALILLSDVAGLLDSSGSVVRCVTEFTTEIKGLVAAKKSALGTGGMVTKLKAAESATKSGIECYIACGRDKNAILDIVRGTGVNTCFKAAMASQKARKRWIGFGSKVRGVIIVDDGARTALVQKDKSLLAAGISARKGDFRIGDIVSICDKNGNEIARGVSNYSGPEIDLVKGLKTEAIASVLGRRDRYEAVHKDNLSLL